MQIVKLITNQIGGYCHRKGGGAGDMFGMTLVTMALHEVTKILEKKADDQDKLPDPSPIHVPDELETESLMFPQLPPCPRPKILLRHRRRRARNRAYAKALIKSLPDGLKV
ncbi:uncharacterized protein LOC110449095 isoform X2 [Mizuhopecten yessoensis]|nr:uncharacterized protein LOC110449095 isoform X2 [Mizuhopecten yessoensis]